MCLRRNAVARPQNPVSGFNSANHLVLSRRGRALFCRSHRRHYFGRFNHKPTWVHLTWHIAIEEKYSTRGRARLRFEMMHGGTISNGWTGNRDPARRRRYPLNLHGVASMPIEWAAI